MVDNIDLGELTRYLDSGISPNDSMGLSDLDGFLTGIAIWPELVPPKEDQGPDDPEE